MSSMYTILTLFAATVTNKHAAHDVTFFYTFNFINIFVYAIACNYNINNTFSHDSHFCYDLRNYGMVDNLALANLKNIALALICLNTKCISTNM
jgi:hypothetical protein